MDKSRDHRALHPAAARVVVLGAGIRRPSWRRAAVITAWMIIPAGFAWFLLAGRLASGS
jgi:hypothetical protein